MCGKRWFAFKSGDVSWWTAFAFTLGSIAWVANGIIVFHEPISDKHASYLAEAYTGFAGGTFFLFGGLFIYWEGLNQECQEAFGHKAVGLWRNLKPVIPFCRQKLSVEDQEREGAPRDAPPQYSAHLDGGRSESQRCSIWRWYGLRPWTDLYFAAGASQFLAVMIFWTSVVSLLPGLLPEEEKEDPEAYRWAYWTPQVVGAAFLILSSVLLTVKEQPTWYRPQPFDLLWHVGFWNVIGSVGFWLSGLFGYWPGENMQKWGVSFSTYWGSFAFLLGSYLQLFEVINRDVGTKDCELGG